MSSYSLDGKSFFEIDLIRQLRSFGVQPAEFLRDELVLSKNADMVAPFLASNLQPRFHGLRGDEVASRFFGNLDQTLADGTPFRGVLPLRPHDFVFSAKIGYGLPAYSVPFPETPEGNSRFCQVLC